MDSSEISRALEIREFIYSSVTSLVVAFRVVSIGRVKIFRDKPINLDRLELLDELVIFFIFTAKPSLVTSLCFRICYSFMVPVRKDREMGLRCCSVAVLFGALSGLMFNAFTAITVIEHLYDW